MKKHRIWNVFTLAMIFALLVGSISPHPTRAQSDDPAPPADTVKLIFIHHSCGENWLTNGDGDLGRTLDANNYFVSDTNYGWGPDSIGDNTDIPGWLEWFTGAESSRYLSALYNESGQNSDYTRNLSDPGGENQIIMFKSCFPNSDLGGSPNDQPSDEDYFTVGHAKYVYNQLLDYFITRPDKLFIVITAPPLLDASNAANARAFNEWLVRDWLAENEYPYSNVAVWDFHNILTHPDNHHRFVDGAIEYTISHGNGTLHYDSDGDDHPNGTGNQKATAEFVPMLNIFYHRWISDAPAAPPPAAAEPTPAGEGDAAAEASQPPAAAPSTVAAGSPIDDFESDGPPPGTNGWEAFWDEAVPTTLSCGVDSSVAQAGTASLRLDFYIEPDSWATCSLFYDQSPGLGATRGLAFDYRASAPALIFDVDAHGGTPDARSIYAYSVETAPESVDGWVHVELTWDQIVRVDWEENPGTPVNPAEINGFAFGFGTYPDTPNSGTIWIDNLSLLGEDVSAPSEPVPELYVDESPSDDAEPSPDDDAEDDDGSGGGLCPGSMALGAITVAGVGLSMARKWQRK